MGDILTHLLWGEALGASVLPVLWVTTLAYLLSYREIPMPTASWVVVFGSLIAVSSCVRGQITSSTTQTQT